MQTQADASCDFAMSLLLTDVELSQNAYCVLKKPTSPGLYNQALVCGISMNATPLTRIGNLQLNGGS